MREEPAKKNEGTRTIGDPVTFPLVVLAYRTEKEVLLAERVAGRRRWSRNFGFLVFVVNDAPGAVNDAFDLCTVAQLQFNQLTQDSEL